MGKFPDNCKGFSTVSQTSGFKNRRDCVPQELSEYIPGFPQGSLTVLNPDFGFHQLGHLGRVGLVVKKSVCVLFVCVLFVCLSPSHSIFLRGQTGAEHASSVDWCGSCLALMISISISILSRALKTGMCSGRVNRVSIFVLDLDLNLDFDFDLNLE